MREEISSLTTIVTTPYQCKNTPADSLLSHSSLSAIAQCCDPTSCTSTPSPWQGLQLSILCNELHLVAWNERTAHDKKVKAKTKDSISGASHATSLLKGRNTTFPGFSIPVSHDNIFILFFFTFLKMRHFRAHYRHVFKKWK